MPGSPGEWSHQAQPVSPASSLEHLDEPLHNVHLDEPLHNLQDGTEKSAAPGDTLYLISKQGQS